jgi:hypothetical protein
VDTVAQAGRSNVIASMPNGLRDLGFMEILGFIEILNLFAIRYSVPDNEDRIPRYGVSRQGRTKTASIFLGRN